MITMITTVFLFRANKVQKVLQVIKDPLDWLDCLVCEVFLDLPEIKEEEEILVYLVQKGL